VSLIEPIAAMPIVGMTLLAVMLDVVWKRVRDRPDAMPSTPAESGSV